MTTGEWAGITLASARTRPTRAYLALLVGVICISFTAIFTKWAAVPGPVSAAWRMTIAAAVLALPFARQTRRWTADARAGARWAVLGGLWFALNLGLLAIPLLGELLTARQIVSSQFFGGAIPAVAGL